MTGNEPRLLTMPEIYEGLTEKARELAEQLVPGGRIHGSEYEVPSEKTPWGCKFSICIRGPSKGLWGAWAAGEQGNAFDLVVSIVGRGHRGRAIDWARSWLFSGGWYEYSLHYEKIREREVSARIDDNAHAADAKKIWLSSHPLRDGDPVWRYLAGRAIPLGKLPRPVNSLRFHADLYNHESRRHWPAMVGILTDEDGNNIAVHRTWLEVHSDGRVTKAPLERAKQTFGRYRGSAIHLWRGKSGKAWKDAPAGDELIVSEGIEDGLSFAVTVPDYRVAAAVSLSGMGSLVLPAGIAIVVLGVQNDPFYDERLGKPAATNLGRERAIRNFHAQRKTVKLITIPYGKDANDVLMREAAERERKARERERKARELGTGDELGGPNGE
jgi:hypothetical protein